MYEKLTCAQSINPNIILYNFTIYNTIIKCNKSPFVLFYNAKYTIPIQFVGVCGGVDKTKYRMNTIYINI